jgi:hypothetical protein
MLMDKDIETTLRSLGARNHNGIFAENSQDAVKKIMELIPIDAVVGRGDSTTVAQLGVTQALKKRGTVLIDAFQMGGVYGNIKEMQAARSKLIEEATICDAFLTGSNAVTQDGRLVNVDASGNRVAGMIWGHPMSVIVVGINKVVKDLDEALYRIRNIIAPNHIRIRSVELGGRRRETPCVTTGRCHDEECRHPDRACNVFTIIEGKPSRTKINVIVVNEDLGLGWNPSWPQERIEKIKENYKKYVWVPR